MTDAFADIYQAAQEDEPVASKSTKKSSKKASNPNSVLEKIEKDDRMRSIKDLINKGSEVPATNAEASAQQPQVVKVKKPRKAVSKTPTTSLSESDRRKYILGIREYYSHDLFSKYLEECGFKLKQDLLKLPDAKLVQLFEDVQATVAAKSSASLVKVGAKKLTDMFETIVVRRGIDIEGFSSNLHGDEEFQAIIAEYEIIVKMSFKPPLWARAATCAAKTAVMTYAYNKSEKQ